MSDDAIPDWWYRQMAYVLSNPGEKEVDVIFFPSNPNAILSLERGVQRE